MTVLDQPRVAPAPPGLAGVPNPAVVMVTPQLARLWLEANRRNRRLRQRAVERYARDMAAGEWLFNGDPIRFAADGSLLDGQHRLAAIVTSGVTLNTVVVRDLDPATQATMDIGATRPASDALTLAGERNAATLAAILRRLVMRERGGVDNPTHAEQRAYLERHPDVRDAVDLALMVRKNLGVAPSLIGAAYHLCAQADRAAARVWFADQLIKGLGLRDGDPAAALRNRFAGLTDRQRRADALDGLGLIIHAWNLHRDGRRVSKVQGPRGGFTPENFPAPR